jgi:hypothetical protein
MVTGEDGGAVEASIRPRLEEPCAVWTPAAAAAHPPVHQTDLGRDRMAERLVGYRSGPAHAGDRGLGVVAELLRDPLGAA